MTEVVKTVDDIVETAEKLKKNGDLLFGRKKYKEAVEKYHTIIETISVVVGHPKVESCAVRTFLNEAQCHMKLEDFEAGLNACAKATMVASANLDTHLYVKLWLRRSLCLESLNKLPSALQCIDRALGLGITEQHEDLEIVRNRIISKIIIEAKGIVPIPPLPTVFVNEDINTMILFMFQKKGETEVVMEKLAEFLEKRGNVDRPDDRKNNLMWAVGQLAAMRGGSSNGEEYADDVLPLLQALVRGGARAEQRFPHLGNRTPLQMFAMAGAVDCVTFLLSQGASTYTYDNLGWTPLLVACSLNGPRSGHNSEVVAKLLEAGSRVNHRNAEGMSALCLAGQCNDAKSIALLMQKGAMINARCKIGMSPMLWSQLGSSGRSSEAAQVLMHFAKAANKPILVMEMEEDIKIFRVANMLFSLKKCYDQQMRVQPKDQHGNEIEISEERMNELVVRLRNQVTGDAILAMVQKAEDVTNKEAAATESEDVVAKLEAANKYASVHGALMINTVPNIFVKQWHAGGLSESSSSSNGSEPDNASTQEGGDTKTEFDEKEACLAASFALERHWLKAMSIAVAGPGKEEGNTPPKSAFDTYHAHLSRAVPMNNIPFYHCAMYEDFVKYLEIPLVQKFGSAIPSITAMKNIVQAHQSTTKKLQNSAIEVMGIGADYWCSLLAMLGEESGVTVSAALDKTGAPVAGADIVADTLVYIVDWSSMTPDQTTESVDRLQKLVSSFLGTSVVLIESCWATGVALNAPKVSTDTSTDAATAAPSLAMAPLPKLDLKGYDWMCTQDKYTIIPPTRSDLPTDSADSEAKVAPATVDPTKIFLPSWIWKKSTVSMFEINR